ncbi:hypothetical protein EMPS_10725 [Entomortierella parvispora]|uniref:Protein kinase domain-containing protein n=1 Tax=Entomortierella parvispora TaxID=205924 RepID=A0A9P3HKP6_9FUNG|nr:hypothetical protein EMPS_10725 [Entomortierella parvispora]
MPLTDDTATVSSIESSTVLDPSTDTSSPQGTSPSISSFLPASAGPQAVRDDPLPSPSSLIVPSPTAQQQQQQDDKITPFGLFRKNMRETLDRFDLNAEERIEKERKNFRQERSKERKRILEEFDLETPILEEERVKKLEDELQLEYADLTIPFFQASIPTNSVNPDNNWGLNMRFSSSLHRATFSSATAAATHLLDRVKLLDRDKIFKNAPSPSAEQLSDVKNVTRRKVPAVGDYLMLKVRGNGTSACVYESMNSSDNKRYAIRAITIKGKQNLAEVALMKKLSHPNIIQLHDVLSTPTKFYMVLELCKCELLKDGPGDELRKPFDEAECRDIFQQLILGMEYLHEHKIVHRDIKPGNLLISYDGKLKIADFGISQMFATSQTMTINNAKGTPAFMAPESFHSNANEFEYSGRRADIWSMGVTLFRMWNGKMPFSISQVAKRPIFRARAEFKEDTPELLKALLDKMLEQDPAKRITMDQLREDPWVIDNGRQRFVKSKQENVGSNINVTEEDKKKAVQVTKSTQKIVPPEGEADVDMSASWSWDSEEDEEGDESEEGDMEEHEGFGMVSARVK